MKLKTTIFLTSLLFSSIIQADTPVNCKELFYQRAVEKMPGQDAILKQAAGDVLKKWAIEELTGSEKPAQGPQGTSEISVLAIAIANESLRGGYLNQSCNCESSHDVRVLATMSDASSEHVRFMRVVKKGFPEAEHQVVDELVEKGFRTGKFCENAKLMTKDEITEYVIQSLIEDPNP